MISSIPGSALRTHVESLGMSTSVLKAKPGKLDIKRHSPNILYIFGITDLNEDGELELLDSDIKDLKKTNMMEESQVIKMKAELACNEGKVRL